SYNGTLRIDLNGRSISASLSAATAAPNLTLSYVEPDTNNILPLQNNSTLPFPNTLTGAATTITLLASNTGSGTGSISSILLGTTQSAFQLTNLPPLPIAVPPAQQTRFRVRFSPQQQQS